ncbi:MAG: type II toxin-antitoxin system VapC family toxin [Cyanobium sp. M30B3]|nr:MAG: type II toxin-antitoxin system VapC family toxin [Cyanobium sp. M30B3]
MDLLLDTEVFLWAISDDTRLGPFSRALITIEASRVLLSHASLWEITLKQGLEGAGMPLSTAQAMQWCTASGFDLLPVEPAHLISLAQLPHRHSDPFDRLLIAQSVCDNLTLLSADPVVQTYACLQLDARR